MARAQVALSANAHRAGFSGRPGRPDGERRQGYAPLPQDQYTAPPQAYYGNPGPVQHWMFADEFSERVRYSVDKSWRGEMPRTYFFDAAHDAAAHSGLLDRRMVEQWFRNNTGRH